MRRSLSPQRSHSAISPPATLADANLDLIHFDDWTTKRPIEKKYLALFPSYTEPVIGKVENGKADDGSAKTGGAEALCLRRASAFRTRPGARRHRSVALCDA